MKVVINTCYGGFGLSQEAIQKLIDLGHPVKSLEEETDENAPFNIFEHHKEEMLWLGPLFITERNNPAFRSHPDVIKVVEELGCEKASAALAELKIVEIPDDIKFTIEEYDGMEHIAEEHQTWS